MNIVKGPEVQSNSTREYNYPGEAFDAGIKPSGLSLALLKTNFGKNTVKKGNCVLRYLLVKVTLS